MQFLLYVTNERIAPDGYWVDRMLFNGTYPGPTLEGNWGDTFGKSRCVGHPVLSNLSRNHCRE